MQYVVGIQKGLIDPRLAPLSPSLTTVRAKVEEHDTGMRDVMHAIANHVRVYLIHPELTPVGCRVRYEQHQHLARDPCCTLVAQPR